MEWSWTRKKVLRKEGTCPHYLLTSIWTNSTRNSKGEVYPVCGTPDDIVLLAKSERAAKRLLETSTSYLGKQAEADCQQKEEQSDQCVCDSKF